MIPPSSNIYIHSTYVHTRTVRTVLYCTYYYIRYVYAVQVWYNFANGHTNHQNTITYPTRLHVVPGSEWHKLYHASCMHHHRHDPLVQKCSIGTCPALEPLSSDGKFEAEAISGNDPSIAFNQLQMGMITGNRISWCSVPTSTRINEYFDWPVSSHFVWV